jgi:chemotaxis methyl-accepting protein methylase
MSMVFCRDVLLYLSLFGVRKNCSCVVECSEK